MSDIPDIIWVFNTKITTEGWPYVVDEFLSHWKEIESIDATLWGYIEARSLPEIRSHLKGVYGLDPVPRRY